MNNQITETAFQYIRQRIGDKKSPTIESFMLLSMMDRALTIRRKSKDQPEKSASVGVTQLLFFLAILVSDRKGLCRWGSLLPSIAMLDTKPFPDEPEFFSDLRKNGAEMRDDYYDLVKRASAG